MKAITKRRAHALGFLKLIAGSTSRRKGYTMLSKAGFIRLEQEVETLKELRDAHLSSGNNEKAADLSEKYSRKSRLLEIERDFRKPDPNFKGKAF
jgi:hypothetical protein